MIINFSVQNFGPIKDKQTLSFEADSSKHLEDYYVIKAGKLRLLKMGLIYGANASGKTTILEALNFLDKLVLQPADKKDEELDFNPFLFDKKTPNQDTAFSIEIFANNKHYLYEIEFNREYIRKEALYVYPHKVFVYKRTTNPSKQLTEVEFNKRFQLDQDALSALIANTLWNNTVLGGSLKTNFEQEEITNVVNWFKTTQNHLINPKTDFHSYATSRIKGSKVDKKMVLAVLKTADLGISDIIIQPKIEPVPDSVMKMLHSVNDANPSDELKELLSTGVTKTDETKFEHRVEDASYELPYDQESLGTQRYYGLACVLHRLITNSIVVPIDEIESSLHPDLLIHFLKLFLVNSKNSQLIATTHYRELLNNRDLFRDDAIWIADKSNTSLATELYSLADFDTNVIRNTSNILNAYKAGKLGGIPNLGDYYLEMDHVEKK